MRDFEDSNFVYYLNPVLKVMGITLLASFFALFVLRMVGV
jgi:hypothetical protein